MQNGVSRKGISSWRWADSEIEVCNSGGRFQAYNGRIQVMFERGWSDDSVLTVKWRSDSQFCFMV